MSFVQNDTLSNLLQHATIIHFKIKRWGFSKLQMSFTCLIFTECKCEWNMQLSFKPLNNFSSLPSKTVWLKLTYFQKEILGTTTKFPCKRLPYGWPEQECLAGFLCFHKLHWTNNHGLKYRSWMLWKALCNCSSEWDLKVYCQQRQWNRSWECLWVFWKDSNKHTSWSWSLPICYGFVINICQWRLIFKRTTFGSLEVKSYNMKHL